VEVTRRINGMLCWHCG